MKIAIIGATGKSGGMILAEAARRGIDCTAIVRRPERLAFDVPFITRDVFAISRQDIEPFDVVVSAFGNEDHSNHKQHVEVIRHYLDIFKDTQKRLITVGAAGHLYVDETRTKKLYDEEWLIQAGIRQGALVLEQAYLALKGSQGFHWTYMAPAVTYSFKAERTGEYQSGTDIVLVNASGKSEISYADYAIAMMDEIEHPEHLDMLFTVASR